MHGRQELGVIGRVPFGFSGNGVPFRRRRRRRPCSPVGISGAVGVLYRIGDVVASALSNQRHYCWRRDGIPLACPRSSQKATTVPHLQASQGTIRRVSSGFRQNRSVHRTRLNGPGVGQVSQRNAGGRRSRRSRCHGAKAASREGRLPAPRRCPKPPPRARLAPTQPDETPTVAP